MEKEDMSIVVVGHVDHGKSTLIGRLLADTHSLPQGKLEQIKEKCKRNARPFEYAFLLDALKDEQEQGTTIDIARCFFKTSKRNYIILDAPGHVEFVKNMITGASRAEAAILVIDADEGIKENSTRHGYMLSLLGINQVIIAINKMDLVQYDLKKFEQIKKDYLNFLKTINIKPCDVIPVSSIQGDNIVSKSPNMKWYKGDTIIDALEKLQCKKPKNDQSFRMPVQAVYKFTENGDKRRIIAGTISTGKIQPNTNIVFYPSGKRSVIKTIETFPEKNKTEANAGEAIGFTLKNEIYIKRGELMTIESEDRPFVSDTIKVNLFWLGKNRMEKNRKYFLKIETEKVEISIKEIIKIMDSSDLKNKNQNYIKTNDVAECILALDRPIAFDTVNQFAETSRFVIIDEYEISGGGIILNDATESVLKRDKTTSKNVVTYKDRCDLLNQKGIVIWLTGLSGAGKTTIANNLEKELYSKGIATYVLDGDNIRDGINKDLGFSASDREENIRRVAEIAKLFANAGIVTIVACITPFETMRENCKKIIGSNNIIQVFVKADIEICRKRDPKGLYKKNIKEFTGISSPFETPKNPDLIIETDKKEINECVKMLLNKVLKKIKKD